IVIFQTVVRKEVCNGEAGKRGPYQCKRCFQFGHIEKGCTARTPFQIVVDPKVMSSPGVITRNMSSLSPTSPGPTTRRMASISPGEINRRFIIS
ncbi:uncharacterized protein LOC110432768, partial [Sorghum bicolor]|uniref:uncharacterized protein LOC110432768 n=1 Tax=Sorghum bicolor TaxID=4558 RepID=UPI000B425114